MAVLVVDEEIQQSRLQKGSGVDPVAGRFFQVLPQLLGAADFAGAGKARSITQTFRGVLLQRPDKAGKVLAVFLQARIVGNNDEGMLGMEDAGRLHQRIYHQRPRWQKGTYLILENVVHDGVFEFVPNPFGGVFIERANGIAATVFPAKVKGDGLAKATGAQRRQAAADAVEVEDRNFDGGGPQSAVIAAVEPAFKAAGGEALPRNHGMGPHAWRRWGALDSVSR